MHVSMQKSLPAIHGAEDCCRISEMTIDYS